MTTPYPIVRFVQSGLRLSMWPLLAALFVLARPELLSAQVPPGDTVFVSVYPFFSGGNPGSDVTGTGTRLNPYRQVYPTAISAAYSASKHVIFVGPSRSTYYNAPIYFPYTMSLRIISEKGADSTRLWGGTENWTLVTMGSSSDTLLHVLQGFDVSDNNVVTGEGNTAGGISASGYGKVWIINNKIMRNVGDGGSGGISYSCYGDSVGVIAGNWIGGNSDPSTYSGGGIRVDYCNSLMIVNNTIVGNQNTHGAGIFLGDMAANVTIANNIIAYNGTGYGIYQDIPLAGKAPVIDPSATTISYNLFYENSAGDTHNVSPPDPSNLVDTNPLLTSPASDYHLTCASPALGAGSNALVPSAIAAAFVWDIDGSPQKRIFPTSSGTIDIGGDEFVDLDKTADFFASVTSGTAPLLVSFTNQSLCIDEEWKWDFGGGAILSGSGTLNKNPSHTYPIAGDYTVQLIAKGELDSDTLTRVGYIHITEAPVENDTIFVSVNGFSGGSPGNDETGDGTRSTPYRQITRALEDLLYVSDKDVIFVGPSDNEAYDGPILFPYARALKIVSEKGADLTLLHEGAGHSVVTMSANAGLQVLEGFTISDNVVSGGCEGGCAGGIDMTGKAWAINNKILRNTSGGGGGGIYYTGYSDSTGVIAGNWIGGNSDTLPSAAGGIEVGYCTSLMIVNNTIVANDSKTGAGILLNSNASGVTIANNIIAYNQTGWGICQILATGLTASAMNPNSTSITRNLLYQNSAGNFNFLYPDSMDNVIGEDPLLSDYPAWDYHLTCVSPAYNEGSNFQVPTEILSDFVWDTDGPPQARIGDGTIDIGGDEFWETAKTADFVASVTVGCMPLTVDFTNQSLCLDEQWIWSFGDGQELTGSGQINKSPSHTYDTAGVYTVQLVAKGDLDSDTLTRNAYIHVSKPLVPDFTADAANGCESLTVTFTAGLNTTADSVRWSFGDDRTATGSPVTHAYTSAGTYSVGLTAYNICGPVVKLKSQYIYVGSKPDIGIAASPDSVPPPHCSPYTVRFHPVTDQPLNTWNWDFGDNGKSTLSNPSHIYDSGGTYSVRLIASGYCGVDTMVWLDSITILTRPTATLSADPLTGCAGKLTVDLSATYVGSVTSSTWRFDDGSTAPGPVARHSYSSFGVYHPSLILVNQCGTDTLPLTTPITVGVPPVAAFSGAPLLGYEPLTVQFTDLSTNAPTVWNWSFGDEVTGTETNPSHVYSAGLFDVSLADSNACGSSTDSKPQYIRVGGFLPSFDSSGVHVDTILYGVRVDSLSKSYDRAISLSGRLTTLPRRGTMTFGFVNPTGTPEFTTTMKAVPSGDLATGDYSIELSAIDPRITKTATRPLHFVGHQFISVTPDTMQFGTKVLGGLYSKSAYVRNNAGSSSAYRLRFTTSDSGQGFEVSGTGGTINPQESTSVQVYFSPTRRGDYLGTLTINSDDPVRPVYRVVLRGHGTPDLTPPQVSATVPPTAFDEIGINSTVRFIFNEPVVAPSAESLVIPSGRRTTGPVNGLLTFSSGSPTRPWTWMDFTPLPCRWFPSDDTVSFRVLTVIADTSGNHLDGNKNGADEGSPTDDYLFSISTGPGVRPGDADQNKRVDERDILPLARFWGLTGPPRENPCLGFVVQPAAAWSPRAATHADADGNGVVDSADICPIAQFFDVDSSLSKAAVEAWMNEARNWDNSIIRALVGGLIDCPEEGRGREVLHRFLDGLQTVTAAPLEFSLAQNYPNPFNPATVIEYSLKLQTKVRLEIFDIQGRLVTVLEDGEQQPGRHTRIWDGHDAEDRPVASGIYFYRLVTPEFRLARKMVLMK